MMQGTDTITERLKKLSKTALHEGALKYDLDYWSHHIRRFENPLHIKEWYGLIDQVLFQGLRRLCVIAPRDHAKSEVFVVSTVTYLAKYGMDLGWKWVYIFSDTQPQANEMIDRCYTEINKCYPELTNRMLKNDVMEKKLRNGFRFMGRGAGASVRGAHPDLIIGDDVLNDGNSANNQGREKIKNWWSQTVTNMAKPTSAIILEGTVQHELDLLMSMKDNPSYMFRKYSAEVKRQIG